MSRSMPAWATEKQKEGMQEFQNIAEEFGSFEIEFIEYLNGEHDDFIARLSWHHRGEDIELSHDIRIAFDYEQTWDCQNKELHEWQFVFAGGEITHSMEMHILYIDLFHFMNNRKPQVAA